jgi:hypothetical protein
MNREQNCKQWAKKVLESDDYTFAESDGGKDWNCLADRLNQCAPRVAQEMLVWELFREFPPHRPYWKDADKRPYLSLPEHSNRIAEALAGRFKGESKLTPLSEVPLDQAQQTEAAFRLGDEMTRQTASKLPTGSSVHAFVIPGYESSESILKRFRLALAQIRQVAPQWKGQTFRYREGNKRANVLLRALAVYRLKQAGFKRAEAEKMLKLRPYSLDRQLKNESGSRFWIELPTIAARQIAEAMADPWALVSDFPFPIKKKVASTNLGS